MRKNFLKVTIFLSFLLLVFPSIVFAHPGKTDAKGCHTCQKNCAKWGLKDGEYHCHNDSVSKVSKEAKTKETKTKARTSANTKARNVKNQKQ